MTTPCPTWCTEDHAINRDEHWYNVEPYVAASRSRVALAGPEGAVLPAVGLSLHQYRNQGASIGMHITAASQNELHIEESIDFSVEDAIDLAGSLLGTIAKVLDGQPSGLGPDQIWAIHRGAIDILAAHGVASADERPGGTR